MEKGPPTGTRPPIQVVDALLPGQTCQGWEEAAYSGPS